MRLSVDGNRSIAKAAGLALLFVCGVIGLTGRAETASPSPQRAPNYDAGMSASFAIADFDGDLKPDLAIVEAERVDSSSNVRYSIRLRLSAGASQAIGVTAAAGGLHVVPRDVNGDNALDLLVSTAWLHQPVAVLLNDGHGNFTLSDPAAFRGVLWDAESSWTHANDEIRDAAAAVLSRSFSGDWVQRGSLTSPQQFHGRHVFSDSGRPTFSAIFSVLGRAPPAFAAQV
jgi:hypothetical protein